MYPVCFYGGRVRRLTQLLKYGMTTVRSTKWDMFLVFRDLNLLSLCNSRCGRSQKVHRNEGKNLRVFLRRG